MKCFQEHTPIQAADALFDLCFRAQHSPDCRIVSAVRDGITVPDYLKDKIVLGSVHVQDGDDNVVGPTIYVVDDGVPEGAPEEMLRQILSLDSAGTGWAIRVVFEPTQGILFKAEGPGYPEN